MCEISPPFTGLIPLNLRIYVHKSWSLCSFWPNTEISITMNQRKRIWICSKNRTKATKQKRLGKNGFLLFSKLVNDTWDWNHLEYVCSLAFLGKEEFADQRTTFGGVFFRRYGPRRLGSGTSNAVLPGEKLGHDISSGMMVSGRARFQKCFWGGGTHEYTSTTLNIEGHNRPTTP